MKQKTEERPQEMAVAIGTGSWYVALNFNIEEVEDGFEFDTAVVTIDHPLPLTEADYGKTVSAIVRSRYSEDDVEAIVNNYLADPEGHTDEFMQLQQWRTTAKQVARRHIGEGENESNS